MMVFDIKAWAYDTLSDNVNTGNRSSQRVCLLVSITHAYLNDWRADEG